MRNVRDTFLCHLEMRGDFSRRFGVRHERLQCILFEVGETKTPKRQSLCCILLFFYI